LDDTSQNQNSRLESFETGSPKSKGSKKKGRRVSQRKELAVVTLGAVAAIAGISGFLAASPPSGDVLDTGYETPTFSTPEEIPRTGQEHARQEPAPAPSWSPSPPKGPPAAESRGS
jgi:hypothetical protein